MRLIIVRHGKAEADSPTGRDEDRRLRKRGVRQARWLGERFTSEPPGLILSSGHERAISTAQIIHDATGTALKLERRLELGHTVSQVLEILEEHRSNGERGLMLVGHNPQLAQAVWILMHGPPAETAELRTGEAVMLDIDLADPVGRGRLLGRARLEDD